MAAYKHLVCFVQVVKLAAKEEKEEQLSNWRSAILLCQERKSGVRRIEARKFARHVVDLLIYWLQVIQISLLLQLVV